MGRKAREFSGTVGDVSFRKEGTIFALDLYTDSTIRTIYLDHLRLYSSMIRSGCKVRGKMKGRPSELTAIYIHVTEGPGD